MGLGGTLTCIMKGHGSGGSPLAHSLSPLPGQASSPLEAYGALKTHKAHAFMRRGSISTSSRRAAKGNQQLPGSGQKATANVMLGESS